jgi:hypothetical protein
MQNFWSPLQSLIEELCSEFDKVWQTRKRVINTNFLVVFILKLVISKNSQGYKILLNELWEKNEIASLQQNPVSASSICEARQKMPETIFITLSQQILKLREQIDPLPLWHGHRVFGVDGSKINVPRELLTSGYLAPNKNQYYPQGVMSTLYHLGSGFIYDASLSPSRDERELLLQHMERLLPGDVLVLDRGYFSYLILSKAVEKEIHLICRMQSGDVNKEVKKFWNSRSKDKIITYIPSLSTKYTSKKRGHDIELKPIQLRLIKYTINGETYVCATTLLEENYKTEEFSEAYHGRWGIEELYKISKNFIGVEDFHSKSELGVKQECYAHILLINLARIFEREAEKQLPPSTDNGGDKRKNKQEDSYWQDFCGEIKKFKINFKNCLFVLERSLEKLLLPINNKKEDWLMSMLESISRVRQRIRPGRHTARQSRKPINKWQSSNGVKVIYA